MTEYTLKNLEAQEGLMRSMTKSLPQSTQIILLYVSLYFRIWAIADCIFPYPPQAIKNICIASVLSVARNQGFPSLSSDASQTTKRMVTAIRPCKHGTGQGGRHTLKNVC